MNLLCIHVKVAQFAPKIPSQEVKETEDDWYVAALVRMLSDSDMAQGPLFLDSRQGWTALRIRFAALQFRSLPISPCCSHCRSPLHSPRSPPSCEPRRLPRSWTENGLPRLDPNLQLVPPLALLSRLQSRPRALLGQVRRNADARKAARRGWAGVRLH